MARDFRLLHSPITTVSGDCELGVPAAEPVLEELREREGQAPPEPPPAGGVEAAGGAAGGVLAGEARDPLPPPSP